MTGTIIAQAVPVAVAPILTRIYSPADFGVFAIYMAIVSIIGIVATGRYELAIMLPSEETDAANVAVLSLLTAIFVSLLALFVVFLFNSPITRLIGNPEVSGWLYLVPVSVLMTGISQAANYWNTRKKAFRRLSLSRILRSGGAAGTQLTLGYNSGLSGGLIVGSLCGQCVSILTLIIINWREDRKLAKTISKNRILGNAKRFENFPKMSTLGALTDTAASQMPVFFVAKIFGAAATGMFSLTFRVLNMPMAVISSSISQALFQKVAVLNNKQPELLFNFILKTFALLLLIAIPFAVLISRFGMELFSFVFGKNWAMAGNMAATLSVAIAVRFTVSPLSSVLALNDNVGKAVRWQLLYFFTITATLSAASGLTVDLFLLVFVIHEVLLYGLYLRMILVASRAISADAKSSRTS